MKNILVTGANGQLGQSLFRLTGEYPQYNFFFTDVDTLDICNKEAITDYVQSKNIHCILNCAAYTAVDNAEDNTESANKINNEAVKNLGEVAHLVKARMIHISTDYVFDGKSYLPYKESDPTCPASVYGKTKLEGELSLLKVCPEAVIIRTSWLYSEFGNNFVKTMIRLGQERDELRVIFDQVGTPTYAGDLASAMLVILSQGEIGGGTPGIYHFSNEGVCSWYDFALKIMQLKQISCFVHPIETKDYPTRASRPHYSVLNKAKIKTTYGITIPHWEESLTEMIKGLQ